MLKKLMKYEFKYISRIMIPILAAMLGLAVVASCLFTANLRFSSYNYNGGSPIAANIVGTVTVLFTGLTVLLMAAAVIAIMILLAYRFYKNLFDNEGYLSFTLPVTANAQLLTKVISAFIWTCITGIVAFFSAGIFILFGTASSGVINRSVLCEIEIVVHAIFSKVGVHEILYLAEGFLFVLSVLLFNILLPYLAITVGSIVSKQHKIASAVGIYIAIKTATGFLQSIFLILSSYLFFGDMVGGTKSYFHFTLISQSFLMIGMSIVFYLLIKNNMEKKLNLP